MRTIASDAKGTGKGANEGKARKRRNEPGVTRSRAEVEGRLRAMLNEQKSERTNATRKENGQASLELAIT
jgi:hypothetical protein